MKAILEYTLPEEDHEYRCAIESTKILGGIDTFLQATRSILKYNADPIQTFMGVDMDWSHIEPIVESMRGDNGEISSQALACLDFCRAALIASIRSEGVSEDILL